MISIDRFPDTDDELIPCELKTGILRLAGKSVSVPRYFSSTGSYSPSDLIEKRAWYESECFVEACSGSEEEILRALNKMCVQSVLRKKKGRDIPTVQRVVSRRTMVAVDRQGHQELWFYSKV